MSKREEIRARRKKELIRNRLIVILLMVAGAVLVTFVLILPGIQNQRKAQQAAANITVITPVARKAAAKGLSLGDPNAKVKMDVWEDFQCIGCKNYTDSYEPAIIEKYVDTGKVYYTFHNAPFIDGGSGESHNAANAAMCANAQGKFWDYHDMLFANWLGENQGSFTDARVRTIAQKLNLNMADFDSCYKAKTYSQQIQDDLTAFKNKGQSSTPAIFINGNKAVASAGENYIPSVDDLSNLIDAALGNQ